MSRWTKFVPLMLLCLALAACGGGGMPPTNTPQVEGSGTDGLRAQLPTIVPVVWRKAGAMIDVSNGASIELLGTLIEHTATVNRLDFTPDSKLMLSVDGVGTALLWDLETGVVRYPLGVQNTIFAYFNADGSQIAAVSTDQRLYFTTTNDGKLLSSAPSNSGGVTAAAISADRRWLATGGSQGDIQIWDLTTRGMTRRLSVDAAPSITALIFSPDASRIVVCTGDLALYIYDVSSGAKLQTVREYATAIRRLIYAQDGSFFVASSGDVIFLYDAATYARRFQFVATDLYTDSGLALSPDSKLLAAGTRGDNVVVWSTETGKEVVGLTSQQSAGSSLTFSPNGSFLLDTILKVDAGTFIWSVESFFDSEPTVQGKNFNKQGNGIYTGAWTPDGKRIILADGSGGLYVYGLPE